MPNTLVNISSSRVLNSDGSTTVYNAAGNAIETTEADGSTLVYGVASSSTASIPVWYAPPPATTMLTTIMNGGAAFQTMMNGVSVFKLYEVMLTLPDAILKTFFSYLSAHNIKLAIEGMPLVATAGQPGYGVESFSGNASDLTTLLTRIKADGGDLSYIAWDEPWYYGSYATGIESVTAVAQQVALAGQQVKALFPNAQIGDIEPVGGSASEAALLQEYLTAYKTAAGSQFSFLQEDIGSWTPGWQTAVAAVTAMAHSNGLQVGAILDGSYNATSDTQWSTQAVSLAEQLASAPGDRPDYVIVQSWQANPGTATDPTQAGTLASVAQDVINGVGVAAASPAEAIYSSSGALQSVVWTGGWKASQNGSNLTLTSPTGTVVQQLAWSNVRAFSFNPNNSHAIVTVISSAATASRAEVDTTYEVNVASGAFTITPVASSASASVTSHALTLALALQSQSGPASSDVTTQSNPTFTGTATPGAQVQLTADGNSIGSVATATTGIWTYTPSTALGVGAHLIEATSGAQNQEFALSVESSLRPSSP